jgi:hypothetical protein
MNTVDPAVNPADRVVVVDEATYAAALDLAEARGESVDEVVARALRASLAQKDG